MKTDKLEIIAFLAGGLVMILELVGSRVLSPYFGSSLYVWTGMIGVILGCLALGYYYGGIAADKEATLVKLANLLFYTSGFVFLTAIFKEPVLGILSDTFSTGTKHGSLFSIVLLFGPASVLLGCVTPFLVKLKLNNFNNLGKDVGKIYALSTMGSIAGTFLAGYFLIPRFGNTNLIFLVATTLFLMSLWVRLELTTKKIFLVFILFALHYSNEVYGLFKLNVLADIDTSYNRILIKEAQTKGRKIRMLTTDKLGIQSAVYLDDLNELFSSYTNSFKQVAEALPVTQETLMVGGAGFAFPRHFISNSLGPKMDIVEIDPGMESVAKKYFFFQEMGGLKIITDDARHYTRETTKKYDLIFLDAFNSIVPPHHLTTDSFFLNLSQTMSSQGALVVNLISSISGENSQFLTWEYSTLKKIFEFVDVYKINKDKASADVQNLILVAHKSKETKNILDKSNSEITTQKIDATSIIDNSKILTDDYSPVEHLTSGFTN